MDTVGLTVLFDSSLTEVNSCAKNVETFMKGMVKIYFDLSPSLLTRMVTDLSIFKNQEQQSNIKISNLFVKIKHCVTTTNNM